MGTIHNDHCPHALLLALRKTFFLLAWPNCLAVLCATIGATKKESKWQQFSFWLERRHSGMDRRNLGYRDVLGPRHPWNLGSGDPCRNDGVYFSVLAQNEGCCLKVDTRNLTRYNNPI